MTVARVSQVAVEVLRTNTAVKARVTQVAVEILRPNAEPGPPPAPKRARRQLYVINQGR